MTRAQKAQAFLATTDWAMAQITPLAGDASNRRYERLTKPCGAKAVLMDAPPEKGEDVRPFIAIAQYLLGLGLSAPRIYAQDADQGFLVLEDLGDDLFAGVLEKDQSMEKPLYTAAVDVLAHAHQAAPPELPRYDAATTTPLAALAYDWYQFGATKAVNTSAKAAFSSAIFEILEPLDTGLSTLIQRDYHAENLLWLPDREGPARVGLLDFQDAMLGHPVYDLVSVLQDARRDVSPALANEMKHLFLKNTGAQLEEFETAYAVFGAQRALRILGVFARLCLRDSKAHYVDLIPRVWAHLQTNLEHPALHEVAKRVRADLPEPTPQILALLKEKSGTCAGQ